MSQRALLAGGRGAGQPGRPGLSPDPRLVVERGDTAVSHPGAPDRPWETRFVIQPPPLPRGGEAEVASLQTHTCGPN